MKPHLMYRLANWVTRYLMLPFYATLEVRGVQNVPPSGPLVVVANHLNDADPGVLSWSIPRRLVYMTKVELFKVPVLKQFLESYGAFPVRRGEADLGALRAASEILKRGDALVIYPEGTRSGGAARMRKAHPGTALIALRGNYPILPCAITGSQHMGMPLMFLKPFRRWRITLTIGEPFVLPKPERLNAEAAAAGTEVIMAKIAALLPESYRGYYGSSEHPVEAEPPLAGEL
ncbi:MAG: lysophospholipid acyltransferase family protein [Dehalococcoidia bacterium]